MDAVAFGVVVALLLLLLLGLARRDSILQILWWAKTCGLLNLGFRLYGGTGLGLEGTSSSR